MTASGRNRYIQATQTPPAFPLNVYNAGATDIAANSLVMVDSNYLLDDAGTENQICVCVPSGTTTPSRTIGITTTIIPAYSEGVIAGHGPVRNGICKGTVTAGSEVANSIASGYTHNIATAVAAYPSCGIALMTGGDTDVIPFMSVYSSYALAGNTMGT
jgi:hypothetical protein